MPKMQGKVNTVPRDPRIIIQKFPNPLYRIFHFNQRITDEQVYNTVDGADNLRRFGEERGYSSTAIDVALSFYEIDGVVGVGLDVYEVVIKISLAFDWDEVSPQVIDLIKKHLEWDDSDVQVEENTQRSESVAWQDQLEELGLAIVDMDIAEDTGD